MAKTKKTTKTARRKQAQRVPRVNLPRSLRLTPTGVSLAAYHAALSDPFASPPTFIPTDSRPGTFVHKRLITLISGPGQENFALRIWSGGPNEWKATMFRGTATTPYADAIAEVQDTDGKMRVVGAAIRVTDIGRADDLGGLATLTNTQSSTNTHDHITRVIFKKSATVHYKPLFPTDYTWYGGNESTDNDAYGNYYREISVKLSSAVQSSSFVEYVLIYENDKLMDQLEGAANYHIGKRVTTHDAGPGTKQVARHATMNHKQRDVDMRNHNHTRGPSYLQRLSEGVRAASETGATVMGITETLNPGSISGPFKQYIGFGQATAAEMYAAASDALPAIEAASEFAPLMIL